MAILSSYVFWVVVGAIVIVLALIGYLAEGTEFANKALRKDNVSKGNENGALVKADLPVEVLKVAGPPSAWTDKSMQNDEKMETMHTEQTMDDWLNNPNVSEAPKIDQDDIDKAIANSSEVSNDTQKTSSEAQEMFPDITPSDLEPEVVSENVNTDSETDSVWK